MSDQFDDIHKLLRAGKGNAVLSMLINKKTGRINKAYSVDLNHAWYIVGSVLYKQEKFGDALLAFKKSYRHWKEDVDAIKAIGTCYSELENPKIAKYYYIKAKTIGGKRYKDIDALTYNLGNAYFDMEKYDLAISEYKKVRKSDKKTYQLAQKNIKHAKKHLA
mgnify:CR=1 FL=1